MNRIKTLLCLMVVFVYATTADAANLSPISYGNLYQMASNGDVRSIRQEMRKGLNINIKNYNGDTLVCSAIRYNDMVAYRTALVVGADKKPACLKRIHPDVRHAFYSRYGFDEPFVWGGTGSKISTPWLIGGAVVAAGAAVAIAAGGGGGGHDDPNAKCKNNPCADGCYTNLTCNWPTVCTSHNTCGGCDICQNEEMACAGYTYGSCQSLEYISGSCAYNSKYVKCVARTNTEGCSAYEPNNDKCTACEKDYYLSSGTCIIRTNTKGCAAYNATSDVCTACEGGYDLTDGICVERVAPKVCEGYTQEACDNEVEYISDICREDGTYHKCSPRTNTAHCDTLNPHADACEKCETGYKIAGAICVKDGEAGPCDDYIEKLNSCPNPNTQYLSSCPADSSYKRCENRTKDTSHCATLNPNADACSVCESGYHVTNGVCYEDGAVCEGYTQGLSSCPNQNSQYLVSCADDSSYKKCETRTNTANCATYEIDADRCASCSTGYNLSNGVCIEDIAQTLTNTTAIVHIGETGNVYGLNSNEYPILKNDAAGTITIMGVTGEGNIMAVGIYPQINASTAQNSGIITVSGNEITSYGMYSDVQGVKLINNSSGVININNNTNSSYVFSAGMNLSKEGEVINNGILTLNENYQANALQATLGIATNNGSIYINNTLNDAVGMFALHSINSEGAEIKMVGGGGGQTGLSANSNGTADNYGTISISKMTYSVTGISAFSSNANNSGTIYLYDNTANWVYGMRGNNLTNDGTITIDGGNTGSEIYGMYVKNGTAENLSSAVNSGTITITNAVNGYGIYSEGANAQITNTGTISINGVSCTGSECGAENNAIVLNGATLNQNGTMSAMSLNLDDFGGNVVASTNTLFDVEEDLSGNLAMSSDVVSSGFADQYVVENMVRAGDATGLNLSAQSTLFEVSLSENGDVVLNRKDFADVVENTSVANFLEQNYSSANSEKLFSTLKTQTSVAGVNNAVDKLTGNDLFNRMTFEDLTMMRELQFDMNNKVFDMKKSHIVESGNVQPFNFDGNIGSNGRYALYNKEYGSRFSAGVGFAFADVRSDNGKRHKNSRNDQTFQLSTPFGYRFGGLKFVTAPMVGYAYGTYDRDGYNGKTYDGTVEKRMMGLYNEARYPFYFGEWKMAPTAEFNILGYRIKGKEDTADYSLNIKAQNNYSAEAGVGINISRDFELNKAQTLKMHGGIMAYHEFADPYELELGMNGMDGSYKLDDNRYGNNRTAVRLGLEYKLKEYLDVSAHLLSNINRHTRTDAAVDMKYHF